MSRRAVVLVASVVVVLSSVAVAGVAAFPWASRAEPQASGMNTASQKAFGNSSTFVDVTDNPVSLPAEKTIYPPRTGSGGLLAAEGRGSVSRMTFAAAAALLLGFARLATRPSRPR